MQVIMKKRLKIILRDVAIFVFLLTLVRIAFKRTYHFLNAHKKSIIHELDRNFLEHIYTAQKQVHYTMILFDDIDNNQKQLQRISSIKEQLTHIESKYKKNSPALILLGPIATTSIILKEKQCADMLLKQMNTLGSLLHEMQDEVVLFEHSNTVGAALARNKDLLKVLRRRIA